MSFFYVDSVIGTRTTGGGYATTQSGSSYATLGASNVYASIQLAITDGASDDDDIICAVEHAFTTATANIEINGGTTLPLRISCATTADCGVKGTGASESTTGGGYDVKIFSLISMVDVDLITVDFFNISVSGNNTVIADSIIKVNGANNTFTVNTAGIITTLNDVTVDFDENTSEFLLGGGASLIINGGSVISTGGTTVDHLTDLGFTVGGGIVRATSSDLSAITGTLIKNVGSNILVDDMIDVHIDKCTLNAGVDFHNETLKCQDQKILVTQSSSDSASAEYQHYFTTRGGTVEQATNIWRDESEPYYLSNKKVSLHAIGNSDTSLAIPFTFDFPTRKAALSGAAATDVVRIYLAVINTTTLYDDDIFVTLVYPDGTIKNVFHSINSLATPSDNPNDIFRTPAVLPTDTGSNWKDSGGDLTGYNEYYMDLDTSADVGADCVPKIVMHVALELATGIYFDTSLGVVSS